MTAASIRVAEPFLCFHFIGKYEKQGKNGEHLVLLISPCYPEVIIASLSLLHEAMERISSGNDVGFQ